MRARWITWQSSPMQELQVADTDAGLRLDLFLVRHIPEMSRKKARELTEDGKVRINGHRAKKSAALAKGDVVVIEENPAPADFDPAPNAELELVVRFEDARFVVVDKPAKMATHPLTPIETDTLVNALVARYPEIRGVGYRSREPGILHRLDTDTSGLVIVARDKEAFEALRKSLDLGAIHKTYLALVEGSLVAPRTFEGMLVNTGRNAKTVKVSDHAQADTARRARPATTHATKATRFGDATLVEIEAPKAGRHQIRAHLANAGHPLLGDLLYGGPKAPGLDRHFLHASEVAFAHPFGGEEIKVSSPLPDELAKIVAAFKKNA